MTSPQGPGKKPPTLTPTAPAPAATPYAASADKTLTASQAKAGGFRRDVVDSVVAGKPIRKGSFRSPSNPTISGHSSGYHEAFGTTDTIDLLSKRTIGSGGMSTMPPVKRGSWAQHSGASFPEKNIQPTLEASDGARTDTARTILSVPGGSAAGHSGSGVHTSGQADAHDVVRNQTMRVLQSPDVTPAVAGVVAGATALLTMAPAEFARTAKDASKLKDANAAKSYEADRNDAKRKLGEHFDKLSPAEKGTTNKLMKAVKGDLNDSRRRFESGRPSTPPRDPVGPSGSFIRGGGYLPPVPTPKAPGSIPAPPASSSSTHPAPSGGASSSMTLSPMTPVSGLDARGIAMDITSSFRAVRK